MEVDRPILSRPSTTVFIDDDNYSASGNLSESPMDSKFLALSALVCWRFLGDSAFHKKLSPQWIPVSVDLEDSIVVLHSITLLQSYYLPIHFFHSIILLPGYLHVSVAFHV